MSRIYKRNDINVDLDNKVFIKHRNLPNNIQMNDDYENDGLSQEDVLNAANERADKILFNAHSKATEIENAAREQAENIIDEANTTRDELFEDAKTIGHEEGYREGYDIGYEEANSSLQDLIAEKEKELAEIKATRDILFENAEKDTIDLIISIVDQISYGSIKLNPELYAVLVRRGIENATIQNKVSIKVSGDDYDSVMENYDTIIKSVESTKEVEILKDFSLEEGNCMIETEFGNINCGLDEQMKSIKESLYFILNQK